MPTVTIDDAAFAEAKGIAEMRHQTVDEVVSTIFRDGLKATKSGAAPMSGFPLLPARGTTPVMKEFVNELRGEECHSSPPEVGRVLQDGFTFETRNGVPVLPYTDRSCPVTSETVQKMRDELGV